MENVLLALIPESHFFRESCSELFETCCKTSPTCKSFLSKKIFDFFDFFPAQTWVLDSLIGPIEDENTSSVASVMSTMKKVKLPIESRNTLVNQLMCVGVHVCMRFFKLFFFIRREMGTSLEIAHWQTTNLVRNEDGK